MAARSGRSGSQRTLAQTGSKRVLALVLVALGALLIAAALMIAFFMKPRLEKTPLSLEVTTVSTTKSADTIVPESITSPTGAAQVDHNVPVVVQTFITVEDPSDANKMTLQAGTTTRRTDKQGDTGLLDATVDRVTIDRKTGMPVDDPVGTIQTEGNAPGAEVQHTGLQYRFPFGTEEKSYPFFDVDARQSFPINFVEKAEINGLPVYHFAQKIAPVDMSTVPGVVGGKLALPAEKWGVAGGPQIVTMTRWYANDRDLWVEPKTGTIVKETDNENQYFARTADKPEVTLFKANLSYDENTIEAQISKAKDGIDKLSLYGRIIPIVVGIIGAILLIVGVLLGFRGGSTDRPAARRRPAPSGTPQSTATPPRPAPAAPQAERPQTSRDWTTDKTEEIPVHREEPPQ
ncbi:DUF3068 domain-containing protein [Skermania sp. ID1734]|uniref:DUF3068 domain-containing protein n=1 Tax=Skermania sp. ID1734 TaxID=2597516 RepID=UPI0011808867|nr:DUF3068 domain-containing protein [Skermania sp. ID1734]TSD99340.1 DUF3068 domain-containing protein [Skermania sp. ID1734]